MPASESLAVCRQLPTLFLLPIQEANSGFVMKGSVTNIPISLFTILLSPKKEVAENSGIALEVCLLDFPCYQDFSREKLYKNQKTASDQRTVFAESPWLYGVLIT